MQKLLAVAVVGGTLTGGVIAPLPLWAQSGERANGQTEVPVKGVALYSSGVGYFEHFGPIAGQATAELRFKREQINDVLKSLVLEDLDGGRIGTVVYPSHDPLEKTLKSFQVDLAGNPSLPELLKQLRGAGVTAQFGAEPIRGVVLGVEAHYKTLPNGEQIIETHRLNLLSEGTIRALALEEIRGIRLEDAQLQAELEEALGALAEARDQDQKAVTIQFDGQGRRRVRIGYVVETPVWKTSYRLVLPEDPGAPLLQGWAIVENQTDNDWNDVHLSLVSGRPISFIQDLYQPLYVPRPVVEPELYKSLQPPSYAAGIPAEAPRPLERGAPKGEADDLHMKGMPSPAPSVQGARRGAAAPIDPTRSIASLASAAQLGELFQYTVGSVSLPRQRSAMIPIVTDAVEVERLSIYNRQVLQSHPLNGVRLDNTTGKHLLQGPVTVFDGGAYAGDARIDDVPPGQNRLLSFGVDLQVAVDAGSTQQRSLIQTGRIVKGILHLSRKQVQTQEYRIDNKGAKAKSVLIEHPRLPDWQLANTPHPVETTEQLYRFKVAVAGGKRETLTVNQERVLGETLAILPADIGPIELYSRSGEIPKEVRSVLLKAMEHKRAMVDTQRRIDEARRNIAEITAEQNRIRDNMRSVSPNSDYYARLLTKLNDQESRIEQLRAESEALTQQLEQQREALERYLTTTTVG